MNWWQCYGHPRLTDVCGESGWECLGRSLSGSIPQKSKVTKIKLIYMTTNWLTKNVNCAPTFEEKYFSRLSSRVWQLDILDIGQRSLKDCVAGELIINKCVLPLNLNVCMAHTPYNSLWKHKGHFRCGLCSCNG